MFLREKLSPFFPNEREQGCSSSEEKISKWDEMEIIEDDGDIGAYRLAKSENLKRQMLPPL